MNTSFAGEVIFRIDFVLDGVEIPKGLPTRLECSSPRILTILNQAVFYNPIHHLRSISRQSLLECLELAVIPLDGHEALSKEKLSTASESRAAIQKFTIAPDYLNSVGKVL